MLPQIYDAYIRTGKVELIFLDFPLQMHERALAAAFAAACAGDQGKFWEMHDQLFGHQSQLSRDGFLAFGDEIGLDRAVFEKCLAGSRHRSAIQEDLRTASVILGVTGTPAYAIGRRLPKDKVEILEVLPGGQEFAALRDRLDAALAVK